MKRFKVGVVGTGSISSLVHMPTLSGMDESLEFVAIADIDEDRGRYYAQKYNVKYYKTHIDMMDNEQLDIVDIVTAPMNHHIVIYDAAIRGIHINVEKPLTMTRGITEFISETVNENKVHMQVSENYPFMPWDCILRSMREAGLFGDIVGAWLRNPVNSISFDIGVHHYSQIRDFMQCKPVSIVSAAKRSRLRTDEEISLEAEMLIHMGESFGCYGQAAIEFENGTDAFMEFFPFHQDGNEEDFYYAGDLRRLVGTKLIATDNLWPIIKPMKNQKPEFHVFEISNDNKNFRKIPVEIEYNSFNSEEYISKITVKTNPNVIWCAPDQLSRGMVLTEPAPNLKGYCKAAWRSAMIHLYEKLIEDINTDKPTDVNSADTESIEIMIAMLYSQSIGRKRVGLPLEDITSYEKRFEQLYKEKTGQGVFDFIKNDRKEFVKKLYEK